MTTIPTTTRAEGRKLVLTSLIDAPPEMVYRAWTEPKLMEQWFCPKPWSIASAETDVRVGGASNVVMRGPAGETIPCRGVYLELVPNKRIVSTDAFTSAWEPSEKPFMTLVLTFEPEKGKTRYTAEALHWSIEDREAHEKMGFHEGWTICTQQLNDLLSK